MQRDEVRQSVEKSLQKLDECLGGGYLTYEVDHWTDFIQTALQAKDAQWRKTNAEYERISKALCKVQGERDTLTQELARVKGELRKWRDGGRPEALEELRVQAAQTPPSNAAQTAYINGLVCELSTSKQAHADLLAEAVRFAEIAYNGHWDTTDATAATIFLNRQDVQAFQREWQARQKEGA